MEDHNKENIKKGEGIMSALAKPSTRAFRLRSDKVEQFTQKNHSFENAMKRFHAHKPKNGVVTPSKKGHV